MHPSKESPVAGSASAASAARVARSALLVLALGLPLVLMMGKSVTSDEIVHIPAGYSYLKTGRITLNPMHPPLIKEICALPLLFMDLRLPVEEKTIREMGRDIRYQWKFGEDFFSTVDVERVLFWSRLPAVLLSFTLAILILRWSTELWGTAGGLLSLFCYVFDPTVVAHAQLVTTDVGCALFGALFIYWLRGFLRAPSRGRAIRAGLGLGLALATKFSAVVLLPVAVLLVLIYAWTEQSTEADLNPASAKHSLRIPGGISAFGLMAFVACTIVWAVYLFTPDPLFYWHGMRSLYGDKYPRYSYFFLGEFSKTPWPSYFLVAWLIKAPIPFLLLSGAAVVVFFYGHRRTWFDEAALILPPVALFAASTAFAHPIGIRYLIPCFPFLYIFVGRLGMRLAAMTRSLALLLGLLVTWQVAEFVSIWPDHLSYFNEIAGGWRGGIAWVDDSNVDWGQGFIELRDYLSRHPRKDARLCNVVTPFNASHYDLGVTLVSSDDALAPPAPGAWILSSHCVARIRARLNSVYGDRPENWIAHTEPTAIIGHVYYVYDIPG